MRCREWYGWHFPELTKIITDPLAYARTVKAIGMKQNAVDAELGEILPDELVERVRTEAELSMGTDITDGDLIHIQMLCDQIIELITYRTQLNDYLKNRMTALAPNLTILLGELVGARLVARAGERKRDGFIKYASQCLQALLSAWPNTLRRQCKFWGPRRRSSAL